MKELALHILDLVQNSIRASATNIHITIEEDIETNWFTITIEDNGMGMDEGLLKNSTNPFISTKKMRKIGLGLPLVAQMCKECDGGLEIQSEVGTGTKIIAKMKHNHINRLPLGNIEETLQCLVISEPSISFAYKHSYNM